mgnify:CR=1 FL=1
MIEIIISSIALASDAFAVSICKGLSVRHVSPRQAGLAALWFGGFQALMPLIGYFLGIGFADFVSSADHWIAFILLGIIGGNMIKESFDKDSENVNPDFSFKTMLVLAVATSIDAMAVGVSLAFLKVDIWTSILVIGLMTGAFSALGVKLGNLFGCRYKSKAEVVGGIVLVGIGIKILVEHLM